MRNAPKRFLHLYLPAALADAIDKLTNTQIGAASIGWILKNLAGNGGKRYASFLQIGKSKNQLEVFETLMSQYDDPGLKFVALTMYMEKTGAGNSETGFEGQLEEIIKVKKQYPDNLLVFLGIDPRWKNTGKELRQTVESYFEHRIQINATRSVYPFVGLKLYPSMGFYAFDEKLRETFEWAADNGVPVQSHCSFLGGIYNNDTSYIKGNLNPFDSYSSLPYAQNFPDLQPPRYQLSTSVFKRIFGQRENRSNLQTCSYFLEPASYKTLLNHFSHLDNLPKSLKICLAHYGGDSHILDENGQKVSSPLFGIESINWCRQIKDLMRQFPNVYTDISYSVANPKTHNPVFKDLIDPAIGNQIMFGTDFFLTERVLPEKNDYSIFKSCALAFPIGTSNAWEKVASVNPENFLRSKYYNGTVI